MVLRELYDAGKFMWNDLGLGKFAKKNAGKFIGSAVRRLPDTWKDKAIAAGEFIEEKTKGLFGPQNEVVENLSAGVKEAKGIETPFRSIADGDKNAVVQHQLILPQEQTIQYVNSLGKAKHFRLRKRIGKRPRFHGKTRIKINSAKFAKKKGKRKK